MSAARSRVPLALTCTLVLACGGTSGDAEPSDAGAAAGDRDPQAPAAAVETRPAPSLPSTPAGRLVSQSIEFHDPDGAWWSRPISLRWVSSRPGGEQRIARLAVDNAARRFELGMDLRGHALEMNVDGDSARTLVDGAPGAEASPDVRERLRLHREDGRYWQNYFLFLVGLPMKLADPGATLARAPDTTDFQGRDALAVEVRYDPDDRYPWWEFYFAPDDGRLVGARFWNEGRNADGEYITMDGLAEAGSLRLPAERRWYTNADDEHLGTDRVEGLEVGPRG